jgi:ribosome-binding protein aMBF1 (putative translation factor)
MKLKNWMQQRAMSTRELADGLGYQIGYLYKIVREEMIPSKRLAEHIERYTGGEVLIADLGYVEKKPCRCPTCGNLTKKMKA